MLGRTGKPVALIQRFDRRPGQRIPYISARTALGRRGAEHGSYTEIADAIRTICKNALADLHELWARIVFSILVTNTDDHLKNHGFLYNGDGLWRLSPVFDVNPQPERHRLLKTAIMEGEPFDASLDLALEVAGFFSLADVEARARARTMAERVSSDWRKEAGRQGVSGTELRALAPAFEHEEMEKALAL